MNLIKIVPIFIKEHIVTSGLRQAFCIVSCKYLWNLLLSRQLFILLLGHWRVVKSSGLDIE